MDSPNGALQKQRSPSTDGEKFFRAYTRILEMLVLSKPLEEILDSIALLVEEISPVEAWCAISRISGDPPTREFTAAPGVPAAFIDSLRELHMSPTDGTCGKAIETGRIVIVEDILGNPDYAMFHELSRTSGIDASWTLPVSGENGAIIAVITIFYRQARGPRNEETGRVEDLRHLVSLAIEKSIAAESLKQSTRRFRSIAAATNDAIWEWNLIEDTVWWCDEFSKLFGYEGAKSGPDFEAWKDRIHPDDRDRILENLEASLRGTSKHWSAEYRFLRTDGSYAHVHDQAEIVSDSSGEVVKMVGGMSDISSEKESEKELRTLNRALEMLRACNQVLARATDEKQLLTDICRVTVEVGGYFLAWVGYAGTGDDKPIDPVARFGRKSDYVDKIRLSFSPDIPAGQGPGGTTIRTGKATICEDILNEGSAFAWKSEALGRDFRSLICLPLRNENTCFGFIALYSTEVNAVGKDEEKLLQELADNVAFGIMAIRNRAREETTRGAIVKTAQTISDEVGSDFYQLLTANMVEALDADGALIGRVDEKNHSVTSLSFMLDGTQHENITYPLRDTPCEGVTSEENLTANEVCIFPDNIQNLFPEDHALTEMGIEAYAGVALIGKDGKITGILSLLFKKPINDPPLVNHILRIFAERAASELERHDTHARIREQASLLDKARDAIFTHDLRHRIQFWNKSAERLYRHTADSAEGKDVRTLLHGETDAYDTAHAHTLEHGEWMGELNQTDRDGTRLIVESRWSLLRNPHDEPVSILSINTDVTSHRQLERQFLRAQRLESIGTLAGGLAHDLNNALTPISMSIELLRSSVKDDRDSELLETIARSSQRCTEMVGQILSFARGDEGRRIRVSGSEIITEITSIIRDTFPKTIRTETSLDPELWPVHGDSTQLHQVLLNLCVNARDAMPHGGEIFISATNLMIEGDLLSKNIDAKKGPYIRIGVEDNGIGIPPEIIGRIYDPFFTTKDVGKGTGLGLPTTLTIVKSHGGFINAYSEPGKGTAFRVYLPAVPDEHGIPSAVTTLENMPSGRGETILLIDDEEAILDMTSRMLRNAGYHAITAASGEQGVAIFRERHDEIDLVITDMMMPGIDGTETVARMLEIDPDATFIAVSGIRANEEIFRSGTRGVRSFLQKPYSADALLNTIASVFRKSSK